MNKKITVEDILDKDPCEEWTEERLRAKIGEGKTLLEILDMEDVSANNRIWCVTQFLDEKTNRAFAVWCIGQCNTDYKELTEYVAEIWAKHHETYRAADLAAYWMAHQPTTRNKQIAKLKEMINNG